MRKTQQFRWALELTAPRLDMDDALAWFGSCADPTIRNVGNEASPLFALTSPQMEGLTTPQEVEEVARRLLAIVNGVLFALEADRQPLTSDGVMERTSSGWHKFGTVFMHGRSRARAEAMALVQGEPSPQYTRPPPALRWAAAAQHDQTVADIFQYLSAKPDWFNFYKAFELMRHDINQRIGGQRQEQMGWPSKRDLDHFRLSAQVYRHAPPWDSDYAPAKAMPLPEATRFIQSLTNTWLNWRFP